MSRERGNDLEGGGEREIRWRRRKKKEKEGERGGEEGPGGAIQGERGKGPEGGKNKDEEAVFGARILARLPSLKLQY